VVRWNRRSIDASRPVILSVAAGAALAATANLVALAQSLASVDSVRTLVTRLMTSRISVQVTDVNAAGSFFAMAGFVAIALYEQARRTGARDRAWAAVTAAVFAALWLTGSRTAVVCTIVLVAVAVGAER